MRDQGIPNVVTEIKGKMSALNYCLLLCRKNGLGCALDCGLRKRWKIPGPKGAEEDWKYYE